MECRPVTLLALHLAPVWRQQRYREMTGILMFGNPYSDFGAIRIKARIQGN
jgi:hypothetical protein